MIKCNYKLPEIPPHPELRWIWRPDEEETIKEYGRACAEAAVEAAQEAAHTELMKAVDAAIKAKEDLTRVLSSIGCSHAKREG